MILIYGGAYQGKLEYAIDEYDIKAEEIYTCKAPENWESPDDALELAGLARTIRLLEKRGKTIKVINHLENFSFVLAEQTHANINSNINENTKQPSENININQNDRAATYFENNVDIFNDKIIIMEDISMGIVPMDSVQRAWREENGRLAAKISKKADTVIRVFCGLPHRLK